MSQIPLKSINKLIQKALPKINKALPAAIAAAGLDSIATVTSGSDSWSFTYDGAGATLAVSDNLTNLTGLGNAQIGSLEVTSTQGSRSSFTANGTIDVNTNNQPLAVDWSGTATGTGEVLGISKQIFSDGVSGTGSADCTATGTVTVEGGVTGKALTIQSVVVTSLALSTSGYGFSVNGLPSIVNSLAGDVASFVAGQLGPWVDSNLDGPVESAINEALAGVFPKSIALP